jgi:acyl-CoA thioesterase FadM
MAQSQAPGFVIAEATVSYRSQAMIGEPLAIEIATLEVGTRSWVWGYRIVDPRDDRLVAEGRTVQVMFDYDARRSVAVPDALRAALARV